MTNGKYKQTASESTVSIHHIVQAKVIARGTQADTQTKTTMLHIVANPIEKQPRKSDCVECLSIAPHITGYIVYRSSDMQVKVMKRIMLNTNSFHVADLLARRVDLF